MASTSDADFQLMYDIFLSFRGLDTRKKFTDHLYKALKLEGFQTFRDDDVIERGENIKSELRKAIRNSRMSVIVLSKNYANSTACLFEIRTILEHRMELDHWILPVFYEVDPWEIKEQAKSLDFREKKVTVEEVKGWKAALKEVASMAGMVSQNQCDGYEAKFIENIVGVLKSKLAGKHRRVGSHLELDKSMQNLKRKVEYLSSQENDINAEISRAKSQPWKRPKKEVEVWLRDVQQLKDDVQRLEQEAVGERNVFSHALLGKHVVEKVQEVSELQEKGRVFNGLLIDEHPIGRLFIPLTKDFVQSTKARNTENIWECLMNDEVGRVGIYGMGGIGKTTIMKHIHNRLLEETGKFDFVFWVNTVSKEFDTLKLQMRIAKALNLNLVDDEDETIRASKLYAALSQKKKYVLILDDLWEAFPLDSVGIPEPNRSNGCKLVLTTRSLDVCRRMDFTTVKVELLTEQEALTLFLSKATGHDMVLAPDVEDIACLIAKECACLPLAIVTVAGSLRGLKGTREWRNALNGLISSTKEVSDGEREVFERLKFSYNRLGDEVLKDCFLYCSMYPEDHDIPVEELIEYWIAEGLIAEMKSVEAKFDRGHTILGKLTSSCLLESSTDIDGQECLRMHDLIRDMALRITASRPRFMVKAGEGLDSVLYEDWLEDLERISLMHNDISELPIRPPVCPRLTTLLLKANHLSMIPESFFTNMRSLVVLDLSENQIQSLPESVSNLEKLHALILGDCPRLEYVPSLEKLIALKVFKLNSSLIEEVPKGIEKLVNLRELDLSCSRRLGKFPGWMLRRLSKLQYLRMDETRVEVLVEDLLCLRQLKVVWVQFQNVRELTRYVTSQQCQGLEMYGLVVRRSLLKDLNTWYDHCKGLERHFVAGKRFHDGRFVGKEVCINTESEPFGSEVDQLVLPRNIGSFKLQGFHNLISLSAPPSLKDAKNLTNICVTGCSGLESIFSSSSFSEDGHISLRTVELCCLFDLPDCRVLFDGLVPPHNITFNLKELCLRRCQTIKNIFPVELLQNFPNLSCLEVISCENVEDIILGEQAMSERGHHREDINKITLPRLQNVFLHSLSRLKSIYAGMMVCECLQEIKVINCPMVRRLPFSLDMDSKQATAPPIIAGEEEWWESLEWDDPHTKAILDLSFSANFEYRRPRSKVQELINASHKIQLIRSNGW